MIEEDVDYTHCWCCNKDLEGYKYPQEPICDSCYEKIIREKL